SVPRWAFGVFCECFPTFNVERPTPNVEEIADETLLPTSESLHAERDQHHAAARSRICAAHYLHDYHATAGKQHEPGDPFQWHEESAHQHVACANGFNRSQRHHPVR